MAAAVTISEEDFGRLRREAESQSLKRVDVAEEEERKLRESRAAASKARSAKWPNTLVALRAAKTAARFDERAAREAAAAELDKIEGEVAAQAKLATLRKAKDYYAGQSDRMKALEVYRCVRVWERASERERG